jgi:hypothetical protein
MIRPKTMSFFGTAPFSFMGCQRSLGHRDGRGIGARIQHPKTPSPLGSAGTPKKVSRHPIVRLELVSPAANYPRNAQSHLSDKLLVKRCGRGGLLVFIYFTRSRRAAENTAGKPSGYGPSGDFRVPARRELW